MLKKSSCLKICLNFIDNYSNTLILTLYRYSTFTDRIRRLLKKTYRTKDIKKKPQQYVQEGQKNNIVNTPYLWAGDPLMQG